jgi:hypothetical protein
MRLMILLALAPLSSAALAQQPASSPVSDARYSVNRTPLGTLLDNEETRAVLARHTPRLLSMGALGNALDVTLARLQPFAPQLPTTEALVRIEADLAAKPAPKGGSPVAGSGAGYAGYPKFAPQKLKLVDLPKPTGKAYPLFNGKNLNNWDAWLGYPDPALTYTRPPVKPLGLDRKGTMFNIVQADGKPALHVDGRIWGSLVTKAVLGNYHLSLEYKWAGKRYAPRLDQPENNGVLYHSFGPYGTFAGTWMNSVEFEIMKGSTGMALGVGDEASLTSEAGVDPAADPKMRYMLGGRKVQKAVGNARDAERPVGEWNRIDLYVVGDKAVHVVNGEPVVIVSDLVRVDPATGRRTPLTKGRIQLQSEGAETLFRNIMIEPIAQLPRVIAE